MVEAALDLAEEPGCAQADGGRAQSGGPDRAQLAVDALQRLLSTMTRRHGAQLARFRLAAAICRRWIEWPDSNTSDVRFEAIACAKHSRSLASEHLILLLCGLKLEGAFSHLLVHLEPKSFSRVVVVLLTLLGEAKQAHPLLEVLRSTWCNCCHAWMTPGLIRAGESQTARPLDRRIQHPIWSELHDEQVRRRMIRHMLTRGDMFLCDNFASMKMHEQHDGCFRIFETSYSAPAAAAAATANRASNSADQAEPGAELVGTSPSRRNKVCARGLPIGASAAPQADLAELDVQSLDLLRAAMCAGAVRLSLLSPAGSVLSNLHRTLQWRGASTSALSLAISTMAHHESSGHVLEANPALIAKSGLLSRFLQGLIAWRQSLPVATTASPDRFCSTRQTAFAALEQLPANEQVGAVADAFSHAHPGAVSFKDCSRVEHSAVLWLPSDVAFSKQCMALLNRFVHGSHLDASLMTGVVRLFLLSPVGLCHRLVSEAASNRGQAHELVMILKALWPLPALCYGERKASYLVLAIRRFLSDASPEQSQLAGRENVLHFIAACITADACVDSAELVMYGLLPLLHAGAPKPCTALALSTMCAVYSAFIPAGRSEAGISGTALDLPAAWVLDAAPAQVLVSLCELLDALCPSRWVACELADELLLLLHRLMHTIIRWLEKGNRFAPSLHEHLARFIGSAMWRTQVLLQPLQCALQQGGLSAQSARASPLPLQRQLRRCSDVKSPAAVELYDALDSLLSLAVVGAITACREGVRALRGALASHHADISRSDHDVIRITVLLLAEHLPTLPETSYACVVEAFVCSLIQSNILSYDALVTYLPPELRSHPSEQEQIPVACGSSASVRVRPPAHARDRSTLDACVHEAPPGGTLDTRHSNKWMTDPSALESETTSAHRVGTEWRPACEAPMLK